jgi:hypothetical protein
MPHTITPGAAVSAINVEMKLRQASQSSHCLAGKPVSACLAAGGSY